MPGAAINDSLWAEMTPAQKCEAVFAGQATLHQLVAGLLDGPAELERLCRRVLVRADVSCMQFPAPLSSPSEPNNSDQPGANGLNDTGPSPNTAAKSAAPDRPAGKRRRLGLPIGYLPRLRR
jgi:hypothetical protein